MHDNVLTYSGRLVLVNCVKRLPRHPTENQILEVATKRERLQSRLDAFHMKASSYLVDMDYDPTEEEWLANDDPDDADDIDDPDGGPPESDDGVVEADTLEPEHVPIMLPSTFGIQRCIDVNMRDAAEKELTLRQGQANDSLQGLRYAIGHKSFLFRTKLRAATSKVQKLRSWDDIGGVTGTVQQHARVYRRARKALIRLGASDAIMKKYQVLKPEHLKSSTAIVDPNARGQRNAKLAWFWSHDVAGDSFNNDLMKECE
jgi:hypothetical protein